MKQTLQKASLSKRMAAWMFDGILTVILAIGFGLILSSLLNFNQYRNDLNAAYEKYGNQYGINFDITAEDYAAMTDAEKENYDKAYEALIADEDAMRAYNMTVNLTMAIVTFGILFAIVLWDLVIPLWLKNGQSLGKKIFGICVIRNDGVKANTIQLVTRALLGKFTIETMIPVFVVMLTLFGSVNLFSLAVVAAVFVLQLGCLLFTTNNCAIHDVMVGTAVVDLQSQNIFGSTEELIAYQKRVAAERAARQTY